MGWLSTDIVELIVGELKGDRKALQTCSLLSTQWVEPAQRLLFCAVELENRERFETLLSILDARPYLGKHIRDITLSQDGHDRAWFKVPPPGGLIALSERVSCVEKLAISNMVWSDLHPGLRQCLLSGPLTRMACKVHFHNCTFDNDYNFLELLHAYPRLDGLKVQYTEWESPPASTTYRGVPALHRPLKELSLLSPLYSTDPIVQRGFVASLPLQCLEKVTLALYDEHDAGFANTIFQVAGSSMQHITLRDVDRARKSPHLSPIIVPKVKSYFKLSFSPQFKASYNVA